jgi:hypothetical protein
MRRVSIQRRAVPPSLHSLAADRLEDETLLTPARQRELNLQARVMSRELALD